MASEQLKSLMRNYGVTTQRDLIGAIADEYERETGQRFTRGDAALLLDGMLEAEYQKIAGGAYIATCDTCGRTDDHAHPVPWIGEEYSEPTFEEGYL